MTRRIRSAARWFLAIILMFAGAGKLVSRGEFAKALSETGFATSGEAQVLSVVVPPMEIVLAVSLALGVFNRLVGPIVLTLSLCFTTIHGCALVNGAIRCGCLDFALRSGPREIIMFGISGGMLLCALVLVLTQRSLQQAPDVRQPAGISVSAAGD